MIGKLRLIYKFITSQAGQQIITIHILPNTSRRKSNQTMKFGQLREYNRNIYLEKLCTKCAEEASSKLFHKKIKNEYISGSTV